MPEKDDSDQSVVVSERVCQKMRSVCPKSNQGEEYAHHGKRKADLLVRSCNKNRMIMRTIISAIIPLILLAHLVHPIECDSISGGAHGGSSSRRTELCSSCVGDNSTCRVVSGIFTRPQLNVGYNMVAHIPRGACNLNITEIRKSSNHLALRKKDGSFIFNGDWRLSWTGDYEGAGATFHYARQDLKTLESITSLGPIQEPIDLMVLYQQPNPGIKYEYMFPFTTEQPLPPVPLIQDPLTLTRADSGRHLHLRQPAAATSRPASYVHLPPGAGSANGATVLQQQPQQQQAVYPYNSIPSFPVKPNEPVGPPGAPTGASQGAILSPGDSSFPYNTKYQAQTGGGVLISNHHHLHNHHGRRRNHAGDHHRATPGNKPVIPLPAGVVPTDKKFYWKIFGYTNCTEPCGGGQQRSIIRCVRNPTGNPVSDRRCSSDEKPASQPIRCNLKPCPAEWVIGDWSSCSSECGEGHKTRTIHCQQRISPTLTMRVAEGACLQHKPETRVACQLRPCNHWQTSEWSQCGARCGNSVRKRSVICLGASGQRLSLEECDQVEKPAELTPCNMGPCEGVDWFVSEFSPCSAGCGGGIQKRNVLCSGLTPFQQQQHNKFYTHHQGYQNLSHYSYKTRKSSSSELETNLIEEDDDLPLDGTHAVDGESQLHASGSFLPHHQQQPEDPQHFFCDESRRPVDERECFSDRSCGEPVWFTGDWGECTAVSCGNGIRTRQVLCVLFTRGKFKVASESLCEPDGKPDDKEICESSSQCPPRWFTTEWGECSALCGGGIQKRSVSCRASNWTLSSSLCSDKERPNERRSCNEQKCTLTPVTVVNGSSDGVPTYGGGRQSPTLSVSPTHQASILAGGRSGGSGSSSSHRHQQNELNENENDTECTDQYRNCALVVQARLCRYKYYRSVCCNSCSDSIV
ncbi:Thrombospondin type-1 domain-containing protein 4 [Orchesella cincta]|uniref:Thrombospondin type-1 domain-containing protein 4 n=1 Tax=Orchesella cincta TaxID=48709 RepID=A0A1D2NB99_ORCCI|nr:Thrombospondin type-1 domain-containing protein 4 [Orchesella cincta]